MRELHKQGLAQTLAVPGLAKRSPAAHPSIRGQGPGWRRVVEGADTSPGPCTPKAAYLQVRCFAADRSRDRIGAAAADSGCMVECWRWGYNSGW